MLFAKFRNSLTGPASPIEPPAVSDSVDYEAELAVAETVAFISSLMTLVPGDIIATGTPAGVGISRDPQVLLRDGDLVEIAIEGLGRIANPVRSAGTSVASRMAAMVESR
jgi:2-keto-4-pentenoate hydratase/2-oxohepta-3-ene-1,7-dioic acid hydratase in catechol pathway